VRSYELVYIVRPEMTEHELGTIRADIQSQIVALDGTVEKEDAWGRRQLAFEIKDCTEGIYTCVEAKMPSEGPARLREQLKIDERIIRHQITMKDLKEKS